MFSRRQLIMAGTSLGAAALAIGALPKFLMGSVQAADTLPASSSGGFEVSKTDAQWRAQLNDDQYDVLRHQGTERPFTSPLNDEHHAGTFACAGCALPAFSSTTKFDSHTGWPSFWAPLDNAVAVSRDTSFGVERDEVHCRRCGGHLGHVFADGPKPTGLRYCMNGAALTFSAA